jgi:hypothetical protein
MYVGTMHDFARNKFQIPKVSISFQKHQLLNVLGRSTQSTRTKHVPTFGEERLDFGGGRRNAKWIKVAGRLRFAIVERLVSEREGARLMHKISTILKAH